MRLLYFQKMGSKMARPCAASQPGFMRYKLQYMARCAFIGNDGEFEGLLVVNQCELRSVMFVSRA